MTAAEMADMHLECALGMPRYNRLQLGMREDYEREFVNVFAWLKEARQNASDIASRWQEAVQESSRRQLSEQEIENRIAEGIRKGIAAELKRRETVRPAEPTKRNLLLD